MIHIRTWPDLDIIKTNILEKFHDNWSKTVDSRK